MLHKNYLVLVFECNQVCQSPPPPPPNLLSFIFSFCQQCVSSRLYYFTSVYCYCDAYFDDNFQRQVSSSAGAVWCVTKNEGDSQLAVSVFTHFGCLFWCVCV